MTNVVILLIILSLFGWSLYLLLIIQNHRKIPNLSQCSSKASLTHPPLLSIIIPTRNEGKCITSLITSLKQQTYPRFEVIIVDDSKEYNFTIIQECIAGDTRFRLVKQNPLPADWVGKPFALQQGSKLARGSYLLFIDADTTCNPLLVEKAVSHFLSEDIDLLTLIPRHHCISLWEKIVQPIPLGILPALCPLAKVNDPASKHAVAFGPFILIKRKVFTKIKGYTTIKNRIADDAEFAQLVKHAGYRLEVAHAQSLMSIRMYERLHDIWEGWSKNIFLGLVQKRGITSKPLQFAMLLGGVTVLAVLLVVPFLTMLGSLVVTLLTSITPFLLPVSVLAWTVSSCALYLSQRLYGIGTPRYAPLSVFLGGFITLGMFINSGLKTLSGAGVQWKGRRYAPTTTSTKVPSNSQKFIKN
jgi:chlorobactene glucosyltransferase